MPDPTMPIERDWLAQEAALARPTAAPLVHVLRQPPPMALPPGFAAALAQRVARPPSARIEWALALAAVLLLVLALLVLLRVNPGAPAALQPLLDAGGGWLPALAAALAAALWQPGRRQPGVA
jgi:hypothetical protein